MYCIANWLLLLTSAVGPGLSQGESRDTNNWPCFRGPQGLGVGRDPKLPERWSTTENVAWKQTIPGMGWSSPIVWGDRVYLTTVVNHGQTEKPREGLYFGGERRKPPGALHDWQVLCLELATGKVLWTRTVQSSKPTSPRHIKNSYASETPVTDGERVVAYFGNLGVYGLDADGKILWSHPIEPTRTKLGWGTGASPALVDGEVIIVNDNEESSYIVALDAASGKELWKKPRKEKTNWVTPYIWQTTNGPEIITAGSSKVRAYDLKGNERWELAGMSSIAIPTPFADNGLLYVSSGYVMDLMKPVYAIRPGANGDITPAKGQDKNAHIAWSNRSLGPYNTSPLVYDERLYILYDMGFLACYDAKTGKEIYGKQRFANGRAFTASPWAYNGRVFCLNEYGKTFVVKAGPKFELIGTNDLNELCMATPAISGDRVFIRTATMLYCIRQGS